MSKIGISFLVVFFLSLKFFVTVGPIFAASTDAIDIEVRLSVCGDSVIENPEDCEGVDLNSATCVSEGYASGDLSCTISCEFDYTDCVPLPSPTPTPTPSPSSGGGSSGSSGSTSTNDSSSSTTATNVVTTLIRNLSNIFRTSSSNNFDNEEVIIINLPPQLLQFKQTVSGLIVREELPRVLDFFAKSWRAYLADASLSQQSSIVTTNIKDCDVNQDNKCDIKDFSVLLYYIDES